MNKRFLSCILAFALAAAPFPTFQVVAASKQNDFVTVKKTVIGLTGSNIPYIEVTFKLGGDAPSGVSLAVVPAGTAIEDVSTATSLAMTKKDTEGKIWRYTFGSVPALDLGDYNLWFFTDDVAEPVTDNKCWRTEYGMYFNVFDGLDPKREYASVKASLTRFTLTAYSVIGETYFEFVNRADGTVESKVDVTAPGARTYDLPDITGGYILRYTRNGVSQDLVFFPLFGGKLPLGITDSFSGTAKPESSGGEIAGWSKGDASTDGAGKLTVWVSVKDEDFEDPVELYLEAAGGMTYLARSFESGALGDGVTAETHVNGSWVQPCRYNFDITLDTKPADGIYLLRAERGDECIDVLQFEMYKGLLYEMLPGETPIAPLSEDSSVAADEYYRIFILGESFETTTATSYFSIDGGKKWQHVSDMANYKLRDSNGRLLSSKVFDKGFELWVSDAAPVSGKMPDDAKLVKFPKVGKRPDAPKLQVNYQLAHMKNGVLDFSCYDENLWVPVKKGTTERLGDGYYYRCGGVKEDRNGYLKQTGKPDWEDWFYELTVDGMPIPESDEDNGGIKYNDNTGKASYKQVKENYFIFAAPYVKDGVYYPASKPAKLTVSSYAKPKVMKVDYKKETLKLIAGAVFDDHLIYSGIVSETTAKSKTDSVISVTEILDNEYLDATYQIVPTAKKPASCPVLWLFACRGTGIMELESDEYGDKEYNITSNGKFTPSKALEFRQKSGSVWGNWGGYKAPNTNGLEYEYRTRATAKSGRLMFECEWYINDGVIPKRDDEIEVWAAGEALVFQYRWGKSYETQKGTPPTKDGIEWTNIG